MPVLQLNEQQFTLSPGATRVGVGSGVDVALPGDASLGVQAVIEHAGMGALVIRRATPDAQVRVNGVALGAEPTPLMHGDKVEVAGCELRYAEDAKGGATQFVSASDVAAMAFAKRAGAARATAASGGRIISLMDGKEYQVGERGLVIGRDASCDVVVGQNEVSRRHAEIAPGEQGYMLRDTSANGVFVNGEKVQGSHRLMRSDVVRVGTEEFRFYADVLPAAPAATAATAAPTAPAEPAAPAPQAAAPVAPAAPVTATPPVAPAAAVASAAPVAPAAPVEVTPAPAEVAAKAPREVAPVAEVATPAPISSAPKKEREPAPVAAPGAAGAAGKADGRPVLATLEILNEGPAKGTRHTLHTVLAHVGRGAHNDVRLADESVSETHAKLQRRDDGWYLVDMDSTNGSYVGGTRVQGERRIEGSPDLRFGGVKMRFSPAAGSSAALDGSGTRAVAAVDRQRLSATPVIAASAAPAPRKGLPAWLWVVLLLVLGAAAFFLLQSRA